MRIVHVTDTYLPVPGGKELHVRDLATAQRALGHDVVVVTASPAGPGAADDGPGPPVPVVRVTGPADRDRLDAVLAVADVVHAHVCVVSPLAVRAARAAARYGVPVLGMVHVLVAPGPESLAFRATVAAAGPAVTWAAVSAAAAAAVGRVLGRAPVPVLPNGIDVAAWRPPAHAAAAAPRPVTVLCTGRLAPRKRVAPLVAVLDRVRALAGDVPWRAVVVGDGPLAPLVRWQVRTRGLQHVVDLPGRLDRDAVRGLVAASDLFLAPAAESFGLAALEARCAGLPVVALARSGVGEFVRDGVEGVLAADDEGLARAVAALVADPAARARLAAAAAVPPPLAWADVLPRCLALYAVAGAAARTRARAAARARVTAVTGVPRTLP